MIEYLLHIAAGVLAFAVCALVLLGIVGTVRILTKSEGDA